ncbi:hypothetical protein [Methanobacterium petrolearium]
MDKQITLKIPDEMYQDLRELSKKKVKFQWVNLSEGHWMIIFGKIS